MKIKVVPRKWFIDRACTEEEDKIFSENNIISIITPEYKPTDFKEEDIPFSDKYRNNANVLILKFHDAHSPDKDVILMSDNDAVNIKNFINRIDKTKPLIIHCTAGKSRSYTTGYCLNIYLNMICEENMKDFHEFMDNNKGIINSLVKKKLFNIFNIENKKGE